MQGWGVGVGMGFNTEYPNIVDQLALQALTNSRAFSLDLRGVDSPEGKVLHWSSKSLISDCIRLDHLRWH